MRDAKRLRERVEVRVERPKIVWLTFGVLAGIALSFAIGFGVGKRVARLEFHEPNVDPVTRADSEQAAHEALTFYRRLVDTQVEESKSRAPSQPKPKQVKASPVKPPAPVPAPPKAKPAPVVASAATAQAAPPQPRDGRQAAAGSPTRAALRRLSDLVNTAPPEEVRTALNAGPADKGSYTVQVSSFQSSSEAEAYAAGLQRKGYAPFVVAGTIPGRGTWYRVRLGRFESHSMAQQAKLMLAEANIPAWITKVK